MTSHGNLPRCMGGWCLQRENCARYLDRRPIPALERLCPKGIDGGWVLPDGDVVIEDLPEAPITFPTIAFPESPMPRPLTPEQQLERDTLLREYPTTDDVAGLARRMGVARSTLHDLASRAGMRRAGARADHDAELAEEIRRELLQRAARPAGTAAVEVADTLVADLNVVGNQVAQLVKRGELFRARIGHRTVRLFTDEKIAAAVERRASQAVATPPARPVGVSAVRGPAHLPGEPVITAKTVFTVAPAPGTSLRTNTYLMAG